jgi:ribosomal protein S18 acetylase RimI-like enzyme
VRDLVIRPATFEEHKDIHTHVAKLSPYTAKWKEVYYFKEYFERQAVGVAMLNGLPVGFVMLRHCQSPRNYSSIYYLGVAPSHRKVGLGSALLRWAWKETPHDVYRLTVDDVNVAGQQFWIRTGFNNVGNKVVKDGHTVYIMVSKREQAKRLGLA